MNQKATLIDLNSATIEELTTLPGIREKMAQRILAARPFESIADIQRVSGLGASALDRLKPLVSITPPDLEPQAMQEPEIEEESAALESEETLSEVEDSQLADTGHPLQITPSDVLETKSEEEPSEFPELLETASSELEKEILSGLATEKSKPDATYRKDFKKENVEIAPQPQRAESIGIALASALVAFILAVIVTLGTLYIINGSIQYASPAEVAALHTQASMLTERLDTLQQEVAGLRTRVDNLDGLAGRVSTLEESNQQLQNNLETVQTQTNQLTTEVQGLTERVKEIQNGMARFQAFLDGLRELLASLSTP